MPSFLLEVMQIATFHEGSRWERGDSFHVLLVRASSSRVLSRWASSHFELGDCCEKPVLNMIVHLCSYALSLCKTSETLSSKTVNPSFVCKFHALIPIHQLKAREAYNYKPTHVRRVWEYTSSLVGQNMNLIRFSSIVRVRYNVQWYVHDDIMPDVYDEVTFLHILWRLSYNKAEHIEKPLSQA